MTISTLKRAYFSFYVWPSCTESGSAKGSCLFVPTLALYLRLTPIVDTSKRTPCLRHTEAVRPSILNPESWVRELTVVLSPPHPGGALQRKQQHRSGVSFLRLILSSALLAVRIKPARSAVQSPVCKQEEAHALKTHHGGHSS